MTARMDHGHPVDESRQRDAATRRGRRCLDPPLVGRPYCAYHGGQVAERARERARLLLQGLRGDSRA